MAVVKVERLWSGRAAGFGVDGRRDYTAIFRVVTDSINDSELSVMFHADVPKLGASYVSSDGVTDEFSICRGINPKQDDSSGMLWLLECEYSTDSPGADPNGSGGSGGGAGGGFQPGQGGQADDPTLEPPDWEWDWESRTVPTRTQYVDPAADDPDFSEPVQNAAGDQYDPLPEYETGYPVLVFSRTEASFDAAKARKYAFTLNRDAFLGLSSEQVQCLPIRARSLWKGKTRFWRVTYRFRFALIGYKSLQPRVLDAGFRELVSGVVKDILDPVTQASVTVPAPLNANGTAMSRADVLAHKSRFPKLKIYQLVDFAPLNIAI